jgi:hypothetical protein
MSDDILKPEDFAAFVARRKLAWRQHAAQLTWEEKIAAIERMWARDKALKIARENLKAARMTERTGQQ